MGDLRELIERLEKADGPALVLDGMIWCAVNGYEFVQWDGAGCVYRKVDGPEWDRGIKHISAREVRPYSASLDAAIALCERVLPGWSLNLEFTNGIADDVYLLGPEHRYDRPDQCSSPPVAGKPICIALLLATLRALSDQVTGQGEESGR